MFASKAIKPTVVPSVADKTRQSAQTREKTAAAGGTSRLLFPADALPSNPLPNPHGTRSRNFSGVPVFSGDRPARAPMPRPAAPAIANALDAEAEPAEREADAVAEQAMRQAGAGQPPEDNEKPGTAGRKQLWPAACGTALDARTQAFMAPLLGPAPVRLHTGGEAVESAGALGVRAYTLGPDIYFAAGEFAPHTESGRRLLAHELAHVGQQAAGQERRPQAKQPDRSAKPKPKWFWIKVDQVMDSDALLHAFVSQYYRDSNPHKIEKRMAAWHWEAGGRHATQDDVAKGGLWLKVTDYAQGQIAGMSDEQQKAINAQTDERFVAETGHEDKLGNSPEDKALAQQWLGIRTDILIENEQSRAINALPEDIRSILFAGNRQVTPDEYDKVLKIAAKLEKLSPAERRDYLNRVTASTDDWGELEKSISRYVLQAKVRQNEEDESDEAAEKVFGLEELYRLYREKRGAEAGYQAMIGAGGDPDAEAVFAVVKAGNKFTDALRQNGFKSEAEFTVMCETYRLRFRADAVQLGLDILAYYDNMLYRQRLHFHNPDNAAALVQGIAATKASEHYAAANAKFDEAKATRRTADPDDTQDMLSTGMKAAELDEEGSKFKSQAEAEVVAGSGNNPLVDPKAAGRDTDLEKLAGSNPTEAQEYLLHVIEARQKDSNKARAAFTDDPERIFSQPPLMEATRKSQGIGDDTIYAWIVEDYLADQKSRHFFETAVLTILTLILGVLTLGGGWVAAAALVAGASISTYQAADAVKEYDANKTDYNLHFIDQEPSLFWVAVAVAAAALDIGLTTAQLLKSSAKGLKALEAPLTDFAAANDAETTAARLEALQAQIDKVDGLQPELKAALKDRAAAEASFKQALGKAGSRLAAGAGDPVAVFEAIYYAIRKGIRSITGLRKEARIAELMADAAKLPGAGKEELTTAFGRLKDVVRIGERKGMDDAALLKFVDRLADERAGGEHAFRSLTDDMEAWARPAPGAEISTPETVPTPDTPAPKTAPPAPPSKTSQAAQDAVNYVDKHPEAIDGTIPGKRKAEIPGPENHEIVEVETPEGIHCEYHSGTGPEVPCPTGLGDSEAKTAEATKPVAKEDPAPPKDDPAGTQSEPPGENAAHAEQLRQKKTANQQRLAEIDAKKEAHLAQKRKLEAKADKQLQEPRAQNFRARRQEILQQAQRELELADQDSAEASRLLQENEAIDKELNPKPATLGPGPAQPRGGAYKDIPTAGGEVNHIPPQSVSKLSRDRGPAIWMETSDHKLLNSSGNNTFLARGKYPYTSAVQWRAAQLRLISKGRVMEAIQMDIDDIVGKFGSKYDKGIQEMLDYVKTLRPGEF